jgi:hypothetical protein
MASTCYDSQLRESARKAGNMLNKISVKQTWSHVLSNYEDTKSKFSLYWWEGVRGFWVVFETIFCRSLTLCIWPDSEPTKLPYHPKQKPRRGGGLRQINTSRKVPLQVNFFKGQHCMKNNLQEAIFNLSLIGGNMLQINVFNDNTTLLVTICIHLRYTDSQSFQCAAN